MNFISGRIFQKNITSIVTGRFIAGTTWKDFTSLSYGSLYTAIDFTGYSTELFYPFYSLQTGISKDGRNCFDVPDCSPGHERNVAAYYFRVLPNKMYNFYPWGLSINIVKP